ncbi:hypothetical protein TthSNM76_22070 (plasmid) [Thermus thermophilus]|nr:hypothetical protein TthSNM76_22070 [Thermus thermophilus]
MHLQEGRPVQLQNRLQNLGYCLPHRFPQQDPQGILVHGAPPRAKVCPPIKHGPLHINPYTTPSPGSNAVNLEAVQATAAKAERTCKAQLSLNSYSAAGGWFARK